MRDRAAGKKRRDRERIEALGKRGNGKPARDKKARRALRLADAERNSERQAAVRDKHSGCDRHPSKLRYEQRAHAERWANLLALRHGYSYGVFDCTSCNGFHLFTRNKTADGKVA